MKTKNSDFKSELENQYSILLNTEKQEQRKITTIILIIIILTLITSITTSFLSYKSYKSTKKETVINDKTNEYYQVLETTYVTGSNISLLNGYSSNNSYVFYVTNSGDAPITYNINLSSIKTNITQNENLKYTLSINNQTPITNLLPLNNETILENIVIEPDEQIKYELNISFNNSIDSNANYNASIQIEQQKNV